ncbi:SH3 domain-containing protein [Gymnodinialimonas sp. 2305UL16-5]|uniref:COG3650 family protein n=1 Tax=Gymnodinialimonas mytili TaxID=3126503 RepID=UPI0030957558
MIARFLFVMIFSFFALSAQAQGVFPARYDVQGVASDDVLNLRAGPGADTEIVGSLAPDATSVEILGLNDTGTWALVAQPELTAWASTSFLDRQPGQDQFQPLSQMPLRCIGTEPFWSVTLDTPGIATLDTPEQEAEDIDLSNYATSANDLRVQSFNGIGSVGPILGVIRRAYCSDGMSDRDYGFTLDFFSDTTGQISHLTGCCRLN